ncbi:MAG TPA: ribosome-binding factor A [Verrucomicrobiae bacterium]|nr:ribosome-binding factor A [Verrucomicrobiae bacterium]
MSNYRMEAGFEHLRAAMAETLEAVVEFPKGVLVTVMGAKMTANTAHARITLSVFPETAKDEVLKILERSRSDIKEELAERLRLRRIPRLHYVFDDTEAEAAQIEGALYQMKQKGEL